MDRRVFNRIAATVALPGAGLSVGVSLNGGLQDRSEVEVREILDRQVAAWNRQDLDDFLTTYWQSDALTFFSGDSVIRGWELTRDRYRRRYQSDGKPMGQLVFEEIEVSRVAEDFAFARGRWKLDRGDSIQLGGLFTLLIRRFADGWKIIHDHTSTGV